jgi:hypothetical protein
MKYIRGLCLAVVGVAAFAIPSTAEDRKTTVDPQKYWDCAKACDDCARLCTACATHCAQLVADGKKEHMHTLQTCQDCASICTAAGKVTARSGPFSHTICAACADACKACAAACDHHAADPIMKHCADECRTCEKACRAMLTHIGHHDSK